MSYEKLIPKYLDRFYSITLKNEPSSSDGLSLITYDGNKKNMLDVKDELLTVFGGNATIIQAFNHWYSYTIQYFCANFNDFLDECQLVLGDRTWVVVHKKYGIVDTSKLQNYYRGALAPHISVLQTLYDRWYDKKVVEASERVMRYN